MDGTIRNRKSFRLAILLLAVALGLLTSGWLVAWIQSLLNWVPCSKGFDELGLGCLNWLPCGEESDEKVNDATRAWLRAISISWPVFLALWWFRTYDTREQIEKSQTQIEKSQTQIEQSNFVAGMQNLLSGEPLKVEVGVQILLRVADNTSAFDANIRLAFIKRLKALPTAITKNVKSADEVGHIHFLSYKVINGHKFSYAQHIIKWLKDNSDAGSLDLNHLVLIYQDFTSKDANIKFADIVGLHDSKKYGEKPKIRVEICYFVDDNEVAFFGKYKDALEAYRENEKRRNQRH